MTDRITAYINNTTLAPSDSVLSLTTPRRIVTWQDSAGPVNITGATPVAYAARGERQVELQATILDAAAGEVMVTWDAGTLTAGQWTIEHRLTLGGVTSGVRWIDHVIASYFVPPTGEPIVTAAGTITLTGTGPVTATFAAPTYTGTEPITVTLAATLDGGALSVSGGTATIARTAAAQTVAAVWTLDGAVGDPVVTEAVTVTVSAYTVPAAALAPTMTVDSATQITATLAADQADGGSAITNRTLSYTVNAGAAVTVTGLAAEATHTITGLSAGDTVVARVDVTTAAGTTQGATATAQTWLLPDQMSALTITGGSGQITVAATAAANLNGRPLNVNGYRYEVYDGTDTLVATVNRPDTTEHTITGLSAGGAGFTATVHARTDAGAGPASPASNAVTVTPTGLTGDIIIPLGGQSNMIGRADSDGGATFPAKCHQWTTGGALASVEGAYQLDFWDDTAGSMTCAINFATALLAENPNIDRLIFVPRADGGTGFGTLDGNNSTGPGDWDINRADSLFWLWVDAVNAAKTATGGTVHAALWHQGEKNVSGAIQTPAYGARLQRMIGAFRFYTDSPDVPFILGTFNGDYDDGAGITHALAEQIRAVPASVLHAHTVELNDLSGIVGDTIHFDAPSTRIMGTRYHAALASAEANDTIAGATAPAAIDAANWSITPLAGGFTLVVDHEGIPAATGAPAFRMVYRIDGGAWQEGFLRRLDPDTIPATADVNLIVTGLTESVEVSVEIAFQNQTGIGTASTAKTVTPAAVVASPLVDSVSAPQTWTFDTVPALDEAEFTYDIPANMQAVHFLTGDSGNLDTGMEYSIDGGSTWIALPSTVSNRSTWSGIVSIPRTGTLRSGLTLAIRDTLSNAILEVDRVIARTVYVTGAAADQSTADRVIAVNTSGVFTFDQDLTTTAPGSLILGWGQTQGNDFDSPVDGVLSFGADNFDPTITGATTPNASNVAYVMGRRAVEVEGFAQTFSMTIPDAGGKRPRMILQEVLAE